MQFTCSTNCSRTPDNSFRSVTITDFILILQVEHSISKVQHIVTSESNKMKETRRKRIQ